MSVVNESQSRRGDSKIVRLDVFTHDSARCEFGHHFGQIGFQSSGVASAGFVVVDENRIVFDGFIIDIVEMLASFESTTDLISYVPVICGVATEKLVDLGVVCEDERFVSGSQQANARMVFF